MIDVARIPVNRFEWRPAYRIIPTRFPSIYLFDRVANAEDFEALNALEALTNDRVRDEQGQIEIVPPDQRIYGPGSGPIMAAFTHINPDGSRFSDGRYGMFYAASTQQTAVAETQYHHGKFLSATSEGPMRLEMRLYEVRIHADLHDLRVPEVVPDDVYAPDSWTASQVLGAALRTFGSAGVGYRSVRNPPSGECVGLYKPAGASGCVHAKHLLYEWDGKAFVAVYEQIQTEPGALLGS